MQFTVTGAAAAVPLQHVFAASDAGSYSFDVTCQAAGTFTLAVADPASGATASASITVNPASAAYLRVAAPASSVVVNGALPITVTAYDAYGNVATDYTGTVNLLPLNTDNTFTVGTGGDNGAHTFFVPFDTLGTQNVTAEDTTNAAIAGSGSFVVGPGVASPSGSTLAVSSSTIAVGGTTTVILTARDAAGNQEDQGGLAVAFNLGAGSAGGTFGPVSDNGNGTYTALFTAGSTAGSYAITATVNGQPVASTAPIVINAVTDSPGVYSGGYWYLDVNGTMQVVACPVGWAGATPVVGDWNGDGKSDIGLFLNGNWWLDTNEDGVFDSGNAQFTFGFGGSNVFPVVGDWNGAGKTEVGVYANGAWFRDVDGSHTWDTTNQATLAYLGWNDGGTNTVIPVPGDWAGDGKTEMGVYCQGVWFLDSTGSGQWDGGHTYWGWAGSLTPVVGNWSGSGTKSQFGVYNQGAWFLDYDNSHLWDAANQAALTFYGWAGRSPSWATGAADLRQPTRRQHRASSRRGSRPRNYSRPSARRFPAGRRPGKASRQRRRFRRRSSSRPSRPAAVWRRKAATRRRPTPARPVPASLPIRRPPATRRWAQHRSIPRRLIASTWPPSSRPPWAKASGCGFESL